VDVALQKQGIGAAKELTEVIIEWMKMNKGILPLSDNSTPEEIHAVLGISKKNFKKAVGMLFKKGLIDIGERNIRLRP
jgi:predicted RNA-binding protein (virulence factor B family)